MTRRYGRLGRAYNRDSAAPSKIKAGPWSHSGGCKKSSDCPKDNTCLVGECCHIDDVLCGLGVTAGGGGAQPSMPAGKRSRRRKPKRRIRRRR